MDTNLTRRQVLAGVTGLAATAALPKAHAQEFPVANRPIRVVVPYTAGGSTDFIARTVAEKLSGQLKHPVVVENRPGGNTIIAAEHVAKSPPDGHTLMTIGELTHASVAALNKQLPFDPIKDFTLISNVIVSPLVVVVNADLPIKTLKDLIEYAKARPGKVAYGSAGIGNTLHLGGEVFASVTGTKLNHIPYKGASQALIDLVGGNIQVMFDLPQTPLPQIKAGRVRALAVTGDKRFELLPDVPTAAQAGVPEYRFATRSGLAAPGGTPEAIINRLHGEIVKILAMPDVKEAFAEKALYVDPSESPAAFRKSMLTEMDRMAKVLKAAGVEPQ
jgi:tripartite-type tricarboxylate transporter receptor subunit TctC